MEKEFIRVRSVKDMAISLSLIIAGATLVALPTSVSINVLGFFLLFAGILLFFILKTAYKDVETKEIYGKKERFFPQSCRDRVLKALESSDFDSIDACEEDKGNGLRLDTYHNVKNGKTYMRLFEYIPYRYEPVNQFVEIIK